jgi:hypothetical protein
LMKWKSFAGNPNVWLIVSLIIIIIIIIIKFHVFMFYMFSIW